MEADWQAAGEPYAAAYDGNLYAYAASGDGVPYYNVFTEGDGWAGWEAYPADLPATVEYQPSVYVYDDVKHVVYTADDGHAYYTSYDGSAWSDWADLGENYAYEPIQYEYGDDYYLTYTGEDGSLYYKTYEVPPRGRRLLAHHARRWLITASSYDAAPDRRLDRAPFSFSWPGGESRR